MSKWKVIRCEKCGKMKVVEIEEKENRPPLMSCGLLEGHKNNGQKHN